jgi:hypothetical protein
MSGALWTGSAALTPFSGSIPGPQSSYDVTLASIIGNASGYAKQVLSGYDGAVDNILTDPSKLQTIGALTSDSDSHWSVQNLAQADSVSDVFADGARRALWLNVLQGLYGIREKIDADSNNPATFGSETYLGIHGTQVCASIYSSNNSGVVPAASMISYPHIGDLSKYDTYFMAEGSNPNQPQYSLSVKDFAISTELATLLTTSQTVDVGGTSQTGLNIPPAMFYTSSPMSFGPPLYFDPSQLCDAKVVGKTPDVLTISGPNAGVVGQRAGTYVIAAVGEDGTPDAQFKGTVDVSFTGPGNMNSHTTLALRGKPEGVAFTSAFPEAGIYALKASYGSLTASKSITAETTQVSERVSADRVAKGAPVTISASVSGNGQPIVDGTLLFTLNNKILYTALVGAGGEASFTTTALATGENHISAVYRSPNVYGTVRQSHASQVVTVVQ